MHVREPRGREFLAFLEPRGREFLAFLMSLVALFMILPG